MSEPTAITAYPIMQRSTLDNLLSDLGFETYQHLLNLFEQELIQLHLNLQTAVEQQLYQDINDVTHILKNTAALYGAERLSKSACLVYQIEIGQAFIPQTQQLIAILVETLNVFNVHIHSLVE